LDSAYSYLLISDLRNQLSQQHENSARYTAYFDGDRILGMIVISTPSQFEIG
jgi:hypothetical protein